MNINTVSDDLKFMFSECGFDERQEHIDALLSRMTLAMNDHYKDGIDDAISRRCDEQLLGGE